MWCGDGLTVLLLPSVSRIRRSDGGEHPIQDGHECCEVAGWDVAEQVRRTVVTFGAPLGHKGCPALGERDQDGSTVGGMGSAGDESGRLECVDESGHIARRALERLAELALGALAVTVQEPDHLRAGRGEAMFG